MREGGRERGGEREREKERKREEGRVEGRAREKKRKRERGWASRKQYQEIRVENHSSANKSSHFVMSWKQYIQQCRPLPRSSIFNNIDSKVITTPRSCYTSQLL